MSIVIVGGDHLGGIKNKLMELGATELVHIPGRKRLDFKKVYLGRRPSLIVILTDYINHDTMAKAKLEAKSQNIPLIFAKRSWSTVEQKIRESGWTGLVPQP